MEAIRAYRAELRRGLADDDITQEDFDKETDHCDEQVAAVSTALAQKSAEEQVTQQQRQIQLVGIVRDVLKQYKLDEHFDKIQRGESSVLGQALTSHIDQALKNNQPMANRFAILDQPYIAAEIGKIAQEVRAELNMDAITPGEGEETDKKKAATAPTKEEQKKMETDQKAALKRQEGVNDPAKGATSPPEGVSPEADKRTQETVQMIKDIGDSRKKIEFDKFAEVFGIPQDDHNAPLHDQNPIIEDGLAAPSMPSEPA